MGLILLAVAVIAVVFCFFRSPLCGSLGDAMRVHDKTGVDADLAGRLEDFVEQLAHEVSALRAEVYELGERVDFTERALTAVRRREAIPSTGGRG